MKTQVSIRWILGALLVLPLLAGLAAPAAEQTASSTHDSTRKVKSSVPPEYPELARRLKIRGTARVEAIVAADGHVVNVKELGGNPVLVDALMRAVKKWKYEPASADSVVEVKFEFNP